MRANAGRSVPAESGERLEQPVEVVWLHGFTGGPASWFEVARGLGGWRPRLLGHGLRPALASAGWSDEVDRLERLARRRVRRPRLLVGYSMGARVGLGWLARYPQRFAGAVLVGVHPGLPEGEAGLAQRRERAAADREWIGLLHTHGLAAFLAAWAGRDIFATQLANPAAAEGDRLGRQARVRARHTAEGLALALEVLGLAAMPDCLPAIATWDRPMVVVAGAEDPRFCAVGAEVAGLARSGRLVTLPGCGHNPLVEAPLLLRRVVEETVGRLNYG